MLRSRRTRLCREKRFLLKAAKDSKLSLLIHTWLLEAKLWTYQVVLLLCSCIKLNLYGKLYIASRDAVCVSSDEHRSKLLELWAISSGMLKSVVGDARLNICCSHVGGVKAGVSDASDSEMSTTCRIVGPVICGAPLHFCLSPAMFSSRIWEGSGSSSLNSSQERSGLDTATSAINGVRELRASPGHEALSKISGIVSGAFARVCEGILHAIARLIRLTGRIRLPESAFRLRQLESIP